MKATDVLIGAAIVAAAAAAYFAYTAMRRSAATAATPSSNTGWFDSLLNSPFAKSASTRLNEAIDGEREWW